MSELATHPRPTGSMAAIIMIGIVFVAFWPLRQPASAQLRGGPRSTGPALLQAEAADHTVLGKSIIYLCSGPRTGRVHAVDRGKPEELVQKLRASSRRDSRS